MKEEITPDKAREILEEYIKSKEVLTLPITDELVHMVMDCNMDESNPTPLITSTITIITFIELIKIAYNLKEI